MNQVAEESYAQLSFPGPEPESRWCLVTQSRQSCGDDLESDSQLALTELSLAMQLLFCIGLMNK